MIQRLTTNRERVRNGLLPLCRIDNQINLIILDLVHDVWTPLGDLVDSFTGNRGLMKGLGRSPRGNQIKASIRQLSGNLDNRLLLIIPYTDKGPP